MKNHEKSHDLAKVPLPRSRSCTWEPRSASAAARRDTRSVALAATASVGLYEGFQSHGGTPKSSIYRWIFHWKLSILGYHNLWKPLYVGWGMKRNTFKASKKMFHWGSTSSTRLRHQKKNWNPSFSMALATVWSRNRFFSGLQRFGSGTPRS